MAMSSQSGMSRPTTPPAPVLLVRLRWHCASARPPRPLHWAAPLAVAVLPASPPDGSFVGPLPAPPLSPFCVPIASPWLGADAYPGTLAVPCPAPPPGVGSKRTQPMVLK